MMSRLIGQGGLDAVGNMLLLLTLKASGIYFQNTNNIKGFRDPWRTRSMNCSGLDVSTYASSQQVYIKLRVEISLGLEPDRDLGLRLFE